MSARLFPILVPHYILSRIGIGALQGDDRTMSVICAIPWALIERHELQVRRTHRMGLPALASRGGLDACEAVAAIDGADEPLTWSEANERLAHHINQWKAAEGRQAA